MVVSLAVNEPPAPGTLNGLPNRSDILKEFAGLVKARELLKNGDVQRGIPMFVDVVEVPGAYERRSEGDTRMNIENVASYQADAIQGPQTGLTCDLAKTISALTLLSGAQRSPRLRRAAAGIGIADQCPQLPIEVTLMLIENEETRLIDCSKVDLHSERLPTPGVIR
jgi:hypothetical protein